MFRSFITPETRLPRYVRWDSLENLKLLNSLARFREDEAPAESLPRSRGGSLALPESRKVIESSSHPAFSRFLGVVPRLDTRECTNK